MIYALLIVHEALRHGGRGWLDYDHLFRQQAALNPSLAWNSLHPSLVASTILGQRSVGGTFCTICQGVDHLPSQCAMAYLHQPTRVDVPRGHGRLGSFVGWFWNEGQCAYHPAPCFRQHVCASCGSAQHQARDCRETPADSRFKRRSRPTTTGPSVSSR